MAMRTVEVTSNQSIRHRVTFVSFGDGERPYRVDTLVRNTMGNSQYWTRKLWEAGDPKMSIAARCAINRALAASANASAADGSSVSETLGSGGLFATNAPQS